MVLERQAKLAPPKVLRDYIQGTTKFRRWQRRKGSRRGKGGNQRHYTTTCWEKLSRVFTQPTIRSFSCCRGVQHEVILVECDNTLFRAEKFIFKENCSCYEVEISFSANITSFMPSKLSYFTVMKLLLNIKLCCIRVKHIIINRINHPYVHEDPSIILTD